MDEFSLISGFGVNRGKCTILYVLEASEHEHARLNSFSWQPTDPDEGLSLTFTNRAVYLGILVGFNTSTIDIYQVA
jgi:hypothetical protein